MKKIVLVICVLILCISSLCSCFDSVDEIFKEETSVTIKYDDGGTETVSGYYGEYLQASPLAKSGYVLLGFYDSELGGEKYFDSNGKSVVEWKKGFPSVFYPRWQSIYDLSWSAQCDWEEPESLSMYWGAYEMFNLSTEFVTAIKDNPGKTLKITVSYRAKNQAYNEGYVFAQNNPLKVTIADSSGSGAEVFKSVSQDVTNSYANYSIEFTTEASNLSKGTLYVGFSKKAYADDVAGHVKDVAVVVSFVE